MDNRKLLGAALLTLPLIAGGVVLATNHQPKGDNPTQQVSEQGYICPITGEELPCRCCCPLESNK